MNTFSKLTLDDLVEISGNTDEWFDDNFELVNGFYQRKAKLI